MKLHQSTVLNNLDQFRCNPGHQHDLMRDHEGIFVTWKLIKYFQPRSILEIGFGCGQGLGLMVEASDECSRIVSVDKMYQGKENFIKLFPNHNIDFIEIDSKRLNLNEKFDFIMIDGDHSYEGASSDIETCLPLLHKDSILCVDDYNHFPEIDRAIKDHLLDSDFVPFFKSEQQLYFHHKTHSSDDFLDRWLPENCMHFLDCFQEEYHNIPVLNVHMDNIMFIKDLEIFKLALKFFNH